MGVVGSAWHVTSLKTTPDMSCFFGILRGVFCLLRVWYRTFGGGEVIVRFMAF